MKIKYFYSTDLESLEYDINNWIKKYNDKWGLDYSVYVQGVQTFWDEKSQKYVAIVLFDYIKEPYWYMDYKKEKNGHLIFLDDEEIKSLIAVFNSCNLTEIYTLD